MELNNEIYIVKISQSTDKSTFKRIDLRSSITNYEPNFQMFIVNKYANPQIFLPQAKRKKKKNVNICNNM